MDLASTYPIAVGEENAAGGRVVTAPTCGSAGVVGLAVAANASIARAEVGCQGEVGTASAIAAAAAGVLALSEGVKMGPTLEVTPREVLVGDPVTIRVSGLGPGATVALRVVGTDVFGNKWSAEAFYRADERGAIDTARDAALGGSYTGVDPAGLFWSLACDYSGSIATPFALTPTLTVTLVGGGEEVASQTVRRWPPSAW